MPDDHLGDIMGDVSSRRGRILGVETDGRFQIVKAHVPQKELYRYSTRVRSLTAGKGIHRKQRSQFKYRFTRFTQGLRPRLLFMGQQFVRRRFGNTLIQPPYDNACTTVQNKHHAQRH